jgi:hypothetical protein
VIYLIVAGIVALFFGISLLLSPSLLGGLGAVCNRAILFLDEKLEPVKKWVGVLLLAVGAWLLYVVITYPELGYLTALWLVCFIFGLLFLFFSSWLSWLSNVSNRVIFSTDDVVMGSRKIVGIVLLIVGIYIFYMIMAVM